MTATTPAIPTLRGVVIEGVRRPPLLVPKLQPYVSGRLWTPSIVTCRHQRCRLRLSILD